MSSTRASKVSAETKSRVKSVLLTLEKLCGSSNPDREQIRYLCHKLLQLVNNQETSKKDVTSKAGLDIILSTLESCNDQGACLALVSTLAEIANDGHMAMKRLVSHDTTRVLLHALSYLGADMDWRLLSAIISLLAKLGQKDRRFALRARLTGSLPMLLTAVRSSHNHHSHARMLPASLSVLKLCINNSSTNASLLGRAGGVNVLFKVATSLTRKHPIPLKSSLAALNLLIRHSKANASRAVTLGATIHMLAMHRDYHKVDFRTNRHVAIRKSLLNIVKNVAVLKCGRRSFIEANGMEILYSSCKEYLSVGCSINKPVESLLCVTTLILRRCQQKSRLPIHNSHCTFQFGLPGRRESDSSSSTDCFDDESEDDESFEDEEDDNILQNPGEQEDAEDTGVQCRRRGSGFTTVKTSQFSNTDKGTFPLQRTHDELKVYEQFFPEHSEFPISTHNSNRDHGDQPHRPHSSGEIAGQQGHYSSPDFSNLLPKLNRTDTCEPSGTCHSWEVPCDVTNVSRNFKLLDVSEKQRLLPREAVSAPFRGVQGVSANLLAKQPSPRNGCDVSFTCGEERPHPTMAWGRSQSDGFHSQNLNLPHISNGLDEVGRFLDGDSMPLTINPQIQPTFPSGLNTEHRELIRRIQQLSTETFSVKEETNRLSLADQWGSYPPMKPEPQTNRKTVQRLIKTKVLEDVARSLYPRQLMNEIVYPSPQISHLHNASCNGRLQGALLSPSDKYAVNSGVTIPTGREDDAKSNDLDSTSASNHAWSKSMDGDDNGYHDKLPDLPNGCGMRSEEEGREIKMDGEEEEVAPQLKFDSRFESGNLRTAVRIRKFEYDLVLNSDCNSTNHHQWFYFQVSRMLPGHPYRFNIINCEKKGSVFNEGMQPVMYSMTEANAGRPCWRRAGKETCYYRNHFMRNSISAGGSRNRTYFTLTFTVTFQHKNDVCYFAYHYPYTYTTLQMDLRNLLQRVDERSMFVRHQTLCHTLSGNPLPVLTITSQPRRDEPTTDHQGAMEEMKSRPYIFLTARVHPGESNASWTMKGTLKLLLTPPPDEDAGLDSGSAAAVIAEDLRRSYIFKIVPMLNPDGVINGHHRCSLSGEDLNRTWLDPSRDLFPTIYHTKAPLVYCDYHGHSRKMNVFLYGCSRKDTVAAGESSSLLYGPDDVGCKKAKASTARVVVWRELGVTRSYTMESTYCGCDQGSLRGKQVSTSDLENMGSKFCEVLLHLKARNKTRGLPVFDTDDEDMKLEDAGKPPDQSPGCPVNSDAELTPDEDDLSPVDTSFFLPGFDDVSNHYTASSTSPGNKPTSSKVDLQFWRYDPKDEPILSTTSSGLISKFEVNDPVRISMTSGDPASATRAQLPVITAKISPDTGRLLCYEYSSDLHGRKATAPRPFESGLVLQRESGTLNAVEMPNNHLISNLVSSSRKETDRNRKRALKRSPS